MFSQINRATLAKPSRRLSARAGFLVRVGRMHRLWVEMHAGWCCHLANWVEVLHWYDYDAARFRRQLSLCGITSRESIMKAECTLSLSLSLSKQPTDGQLRRIRQDYSLIAESCWTKSQDHRRGKCWSGKMRGKIHYSKWTMKSCGVRNERSTQCNVV